MDTIQYLCGHPVFRFARRSVLARVTEASEIRSYRKGESIRLLSMDAKSIAVVVEGAVSVSRRNRERDVSILVGLFREHAIITDTELAPHGQWVPVVAAAESSWVLFIPIPVFEAVVQNEVHVAAMLYKDVCARQHMLLRLIELMGAEDVAFRLLALLWSSQGVSRLGAAATLHPPVPIIVSKAKLADALGVHRKTIARHIIALQNAGMVTMKGRSIVLADDAPRVQIGEFGIGASWGLVSSSAS